MARKLTVTMGLWAVEGGALEQLCYLVVLELHGKEGSVQKDVNNDNHQEN